MSIKSIGKDVMYESKNLNGKIRALRVSPKLIVSFSPELNTKIEFWPLKNQEKITIKFSKVILLFKKKSQMNIFG